MMYRRACLGQIVNNDGAVRFTPTDANQFSEMSVNAANGFLNGD